MSVPPLSPNAWLRWDLIRRELDATPVTSILELGMGQGAVGSRLSQRARYVGVEPDDRSRAVAAGRLAATGVTLASLDELPGDQTFDLVCAFEVLEHIDDDAGALATWSKRLGPGGRFLLSVPAYQERFGPADELVGHLRRYSREDLETVLRSADLEPVRIDAVGVPFGEMLEWGRNLMAQRTLRQRDGQSVEERTAGSGRLYQPPAWAGVVTQAGTAPFRWLQRPFRGSSRTCGWLVLARRATG